MKEIFLDLHRVPLYGWERYKSKTLVDSILRGIEAGDAFPPVPVVQCEDFYSLDMFAYDARFPQSTLFIGGHTRAIAHYIAEKFLRCSLSGISRLVSPPKDFFLIKEIEILNNYGEDHRPLRRLLHDGAIHKIACDSRYRS